MTCDVMRKRKERATTPIKHIMTTMKLTQVLLLIQLLSLATGFSPAIQGRQSLSWIKLTLPTGSTQLPPTVGTVSLIPLSSALFSSADSNVDTVTLSLSLEKPLGIILEEVEEGEAKGVFVKELSDEGSAAEYKDKLVGLKLARVVDDDVTSLTFDDVMEKIIEAPSPLTIEFELPQEPMFQVGTPVTITVLQSGEDDRAIEAKVGDNLRQTLLDNKVEVYRGMKKKLGNCGGGGQCTFCAVDFVESEGWEPRSEYEDKKIAKWPKTARLACLNNIQGPATIRVE